jgi:hypothetical protein
MTTTIDLESITLAHGAHARRSEGLCAIGSRGGARARSAAGTFVATPLRDRFEARTSRHAGACWLWTGSRSAEGYGSIRVDGKMRKAHRVAWELANGPIPAGAGAHGTCVLHRCDNPSCVNPDHLFLGTNADNARDRQAKGRTASANLTLGPRALAARRVCANGHPRNDANAGRRANGRRRCRVCARIRARSARAGGLS